MGVASKLVCAVVPEYGCCVVLPRCAQEVIEVPPAGRRFRVRLAGIPFADDEWDVSEVTANGGEVGIEGCFVGVGAPGCLAPGGEDKVVC